jgi:hypothetical protein
VQQLVNRFTDAASRFGLTVSLKKTEVILQTAPNNSYVPPVVQLGTEKLVVSDRFCYLGSIIQKDAALDDEVNARLSKAGAAFGRLTGRLWSEHGIRVQTKVNVYSAAVLSTLLYGSETWTAYRKHLKKLESFHLRCLRKIAHIQWFHKIPDTEVLKLCGSTGIEAMVIARQLRWAGHVARMDDSRIPKMLLYGQLAHGQRPQHCPKKRFKDQLRGHLKACCIDEAMWSDIAKDRGLWRSSCKNAVKQFESMRVRSITEKRVRRKAAATAPAAPSAGVATFSCDVCGRPCGSRIGLFSHRRTHR